MLMKTLAWAIGSCLHASVILAVVFTMTLTMRRASASTRHWMWSCAVVAALLSPLMIMLFPKWEVEPVAGLERIASIASPASKVESHDVIHRAGERAQRTSATASSTVELVPPSRDIDYVSLLAFLWASGTTTMLLYAFLGILALWRIRRSMEPPPAQCLDELQVLAERHNVRRPIGIAVSDLTSTPIVSGVWRPLIILPRGASEWSSERLRVVLTHELAHIKRGDCFTQALARLIAAAYWFNPLVWIAARGLRIEQERACDDFVLAAGTKASAYASHLSGIARSTQPARLSPLATATVAMARPSLIEGRLMAILDPTIQRSPGAGARVVGAAMILLVAIPLSTVHLRPAVAATAVAKAPAAAKSNESTPLIAAAHEGRIDVVRFLLDHGADINATSHGWNALVAAAHEGQLETVRLLLDRGADVNAAPSGQSALVAAAHEGRLDVVKLLVERGADVNAH
jgi:bla regulator protein BlaR1